MSNQGKLSHVCSIKLTFIRNHHWPQVMQGIYFSHSLFILIILSRTCSFFCWQHPYLGGTECSVIGHYYKTKNCKNKELHLHSHFGWKMVEISSQWVHAKSVWCFNCLNDETCVEEMNFLQASAFNHGDNYNWTTALPLAETSHFHIHCSVQPAGDSYINHIINIYCTGRILATHNHNISHTSVTEITPIH